MNTLQFAFLIPWWHHKYVTSHVIKVYLTLNILSFEDKILIKTYENVKDFLPEDWQNFLQNCFFQNIRQLSWEQLVRSNALQEVVGHSRLKMCCFLLGSVETQLGRNCKFC